MEVMRRSIYSKILPSLPYIIFNYSNFINSLNTDHLFILYYPFPYHLYYPFPYHLYYPFPYHLI
jgi:hypothetical protein